MQPQQDEKNEQLVEPPDETDKPASSPLSIDGCELELLDDADDTKEEDDLPGLDPDDDDLLVIVPDEYDPNAWGLEPLHDPTGDEEE